MLKNYFIKIEEIDGMRINHIRCLRDASKILDVDGNIIHVMSLMDAKTVIELAYEGIMSSVCIPPSGVEILLKSGFRVFDAQRNQIYDKFKRLKLMKVYKEIDSKSYIPSIREYRIACDEGLKETKDIVDRIKNTKSPTIVKISDLAASKLRSNGWTIAVEDLFSDELFKI